MSQKRDEFIKKYKGSKCLRCDCCVVVRETQEYQGLTIPEKLQ